MLSKLLSRSQILYPQFRLLQSQHMSNSMLNYLCSNISYTPKVQKQVFTDQLLKYLSYLQRKSTVKSTDMKQLTQNILTQYGSIYRKIGTQNEKYGFEKNYKVKFMNNSKCRYHGHVDYMVFLDEHHFFPLMFFEKYLNPYSGAAMAYSNMVMKAQLRKEEKTSGYSLITNGQEWILYKMYRNLHLQKSVVYQAKNNRLKNIWLDYQMVAVILGLIDNCMDVNRPDVETLKLAYDFIDDQRFQIQAKQGQKIKNSLAGKILTGYYQKQKDLNSK